MKFRKKRKQKPKKINKEKKKQRIKGHFNSFPSICGSISIWVRVLVLLIFLWSSVDCSIDFMAFSSTLPKLLATCFPLPFKPTLQPIKRLLANLMHIAF